MLNRNNPAHRALITVLTLLSALDSPALGAESPLTESSIVDTILDLSTATGAGGTTHSQPKPEQAKPQGPAAIPQGSVAPAPSSTSTGEILNQPPVEECTKTVTVAPKIQPVNLGRSPASEPPSLPGTGLGSGGVLTPPASGSAHAIQGPLQLIRDHADREAISSSLLDQRRKLIQSARNDQEALSRPYANMTAGQLRESMRRAQKELGNSADTYRKAIGGPDEGDRRDMENLLRSASDKAGIAEQRLGIGSHGSVYDLLGMKYADPSSREGLVNRTVLFNGLPPEQKDQAQRELDLVHSPAIELPGGKSAAVPILHNGSMGTEGTASQLNCSSLVTSVLPLGGSRKVRFTTQDFRSMWYYGKTGAMPAQPTYSQSREKTLKEASRSFIPVDLYEGGRLYMGDLLVHRLPWETTGKIFVVKSHDPRTFTVKVVEAAPGNGQIRESEFPLSLDPQDQEVRLIRPGVMGLRLRVSERRICGSGGRAPARRR